MENNSYFSYKKLFKKMIDLEISNKDLMETANISKSSFYKIKNSENVTTDILLRICEALNCDVSEIMEIETNEKENVDLGQVFTKDNVADYMVSLFSFEKESSIIDPCFGKGAFLEAARRAGYKNLVGYELDRRLYSEVKSLNSNYELYNQDFLTIPQGTKFDGVIMNPPYIRHEKIDNLEKSYGISKTEIRKNKEFNDLPQNANMYMYFIVKALNLLKNDGELVVIFPSSWLNTNSGLIFESILKKYGEIEAQISVSGDVFEGNPLVDVLIMKIIKTTQEKNKKKLHVIFDENFIEEHSVESHESSLYLGFKKNITEVAKIRRGISTSYNKMFMNPNLKNNTKKIIASPKDVQGFSTTNESAQEILVLQKGEDLDSETKQYIDNYKDLITKEGKPKTLYTKIKSGEDEWYTLKTFDGRGVLFSYIVRESMKFIYNDTCELVRDNFYVIKPNDKFSEYLLFAFLNNYYTYYQLEVLGKKYGAGLLKLQTYDLENILIPDWKSLSINEVNLLVDLSKRLISTGYEELIDEITEILSSQSKIHYQEIKNEYHKKKSKRLERRAK